MNCTIYRSKKKGYTYIYLREGVSFEDLPSALQAVFGEPEQVMALSLTPDRVLAQENIEDVLNNLTTEGFHLQLPPSDDPSGWLDLPENKEESP